MMINCDTHAHVNLFNDGSTQKKIVFEKKKSQHSHKNDKKRKEIVAFAVADHLRIFICLLLYYVDATYQNIRKKKKANYEILYWFLFPFK